MTCVAVVNDDTAFLDLMDEVLRLEGYETLQIKEADRAFQRLKDALPDLIILDIRMSSPENGWQICELLTLDPVTRTIPIIVCSAAIPDLHEKEDWLEQHDILTLPKPFDIEDLYSTVRRALALPGR